MIVISVLTNRRCSLLHDLGIFTGDASHVVCCFVVCVRKHFLRYLGLLARCRLNRVRAKRARQDLTSIFCQSDVSRAERSSRAPRARTAVGRGVA